MTTAAHPLHTEPAAELSATLLRLRAVGAEVARRSIYALARRRRAPAHRRRGLSPQKRGALIGLALGLAAAALSYWAA
jgi:hypothetical protein